MSVPKTLCEPIQLTPSLIIVPSLFRSTSSSARNTGISQTMRTRFLALLYLCTLSFNSWPAMFQADPLQHMPSSPAASAFLLVASEQMTDPRFRKTVILVTQHGDTGPIGGIVNRPQAITLDKIFPAYPAAKDLSLFYGGPVNPEQVFYLVRSGEAVAGALTISSNIFLGYDMPALDELLTGKRHYTDLRVMHGMASWAPGQLEYEIKLGEWLVMPVDEAVIFDRPPAGMWQELYYRTNSAQEF
jgi:putative transcriptional regulator